jgi:hypothetical protein
VTVNAIYFGFVPARQLEVCFVDFTVGEQYGARKENRCHQTKDHFNHVITP